MPDKEHEELMTALGESQLKSPDEDILSVLTNDYDYLNADDQNLEVAIDAEEDEEYENIVPEDTDDLARSIVEECQGETADGVPNSGTAYVLEMVNPFLDTHRTIMERASVSPVLSISSRDDYIELCYTFKNPKDPDMRAMWDTLEEYGKRANDTKNDSVEIPFLIFVAVPYAAYGTYYMTIESPISWGLTSSDPDSMPNQVRILFEMDSISFYETDDINMDDLVGDVIRELDEDWKYQEEIMVRQIEEQNKLNKRNDLADKIRKEK